eukprot:TRINITY_DN63446_c0_g1_i1.p1 TRINITY_DN63446_c0_g1~~TRINITY_DN63446_c0_g1_i1.p1  ORF type:complete len:130 (-),score=7.95 TRINITY_DN63446_c0_g1_i1:363-752(-)
MQFAQCSIAARRSSVIAHTEYTDPKKVLVQSIKDEKVKENLIGYSKSMNSKKYVDASGRPGKGMGVYQFADKYGTNVDGYSPIYSPDEWAESGNEYKLGVRGLLAWAGLLVVLLGVGLNLIIATSELGA